MSPKDKDVYMDVHVHMIMMMIAAARGENGAKHDDEYYDDAQGGDCGGDVPW